MSIWWSGSIVLGGPSDMMVLIMATNPALIKEKHIPYA